MKREIAPEIITNMDFKLMSYQVHQFDNGCMLYNFPYSDVAVSKIDFIFPAGTWYQTQAMQSYFTAKMLTEGTTKMSDEQIAIILDEFGASLNVSIGKDRTIVSLYCLNRNLDNLLPIVHEILTNSCFPEKQLNILLQNQKQEFIINLERVSFLASRALDNAIWGSNHPYGKIAEIEDFDKINSFVLSEFFKTQYNFNECKIVWTGEFDNDIFKKLENFFGREYYKFSSMQDIEHTNIKNERNSIYIEKENAKQSAIAIGCEFPLATHKDNIKLSILNTVFGGYFGSRLMKNIREDKGYTYGIGSGIITNLKSSKFYISTQVKAENTDDAIREINKEILRLQTEKIDDFELKLVKNYLFGNIMQTLDGPFSQSLFCIRAIDFKLNPKKRLDDMSLTIKNITKEELIETANQYLRIENLKYIIAGKKQENTI